MYQEVSEGMFMFIGKNISSSSVFYNLESCLYPSCTEIVEVMNTLIQERHNHSESCITFDVSRKTQKIEIFLANERSGLAFFSMDLGLFFRNNVSNLIGVMLRGKDLSNQNFFTTLSAYIVSLSLLINTDLIECNIVGNTKTLLPRCFLHFGAQSGRHFIYWTVHELSDVQYSTFQTATQKLFS